MKKILIPAILAVLIVALGSCEKKPEVDKEKHVSFHYKGTLDDGTVFDTSEGKEPLSFIYGVGQLIPGLEDQMKGMKMGDKKTIKVLAADAYGPYREDMVVPVPKKDFPENITPEVGMQLMAQTMFGPVPVRIKDVNEDTIFIDYNAPLAGKDLTFEVQIVEVRDATEEELAPFRQAAEQTPLPGGALPPVLQGEEQKQAQ
ncbi:MAG TPA: peptidylprolyl isomerase [Spirochaetales bacterium]|nr:peptidylprolyl isomerase [Spirochaetales bacterium]